MQHVPMSSGIVWLQTLSTLVEQQPTAVGSRRPVRLVGLFGGVSAVSLVVRLESMWGRK